MNERIKELIKQSRDEVNAKYGLSDAYNSMVQERFAELIVEECAEICTNLDGGENMFSRGIREVFGVE